MTENKAAILQIFETLNRKIKQFEDEKNKAVKFIHSMTEKESEFLYRESDSGLKFTKAVQNRNGLRTLSHSRIPLAIDSLPVYGWESQ